ncbi:MAG: preprotein translocase subunit YajC [Phycisphaerales bacterium]
MFETLTLTLAQNDGVPTAPTQAPAPGTPGTPAPGTPVSGTPVTDGTTTATPGGKPGEVQPKSAPGFDFMLPMLLIFLALMFGMTMFGQRKEKKKRAALLAAMKKNDRIVTIGGVIGTVVEVKDNEVIVKVDESNNTRMRFSRSAIQGIINEEAGQGK